MIPIFFILLQVACFFHSKYKSSQSSTYRKNGLFLSHVHCVLQNITITIYFFFDSCFICAVLLACVNINMIQQKKFSYVYFSYQWVLEALSKVISKNWLHNSLVIHHAGKSADIHYGTGAISGFFSQDNVKVGELVVKNQVT